MRGRLPQHEPSESTPRRLAMKTRPDFLSMNLSRRQMLRKTALAALCLGLPAARSLGQDIKAIQAAELTGDPIATGLSMPLQSMDFLREMTCAVVQSARVNPGEKRGGSPINTTGFTLIMPGGNYPSYWIRDFAMSLDSGYITAEEMLNHLRLTARCQNGSTARPLKNGLMIPPFAIPDHINFDGSAVFYPGTYSSGEDQGVGTFGIMPPIDDHYEFIHIAHTLYKTASQTGFLSETIDGLTILDRLIKAFDAPTTDPATDMVVTENKTRAVGFGFCDSIYFTGSLLFPSLLRYRAAGQLMDLCKASNQSSHLVRFKKIRENIVRHLVPTFGQPSKIDGWLMAATQIGRQADVWGTLYALHLSVLRDAGAKSARKTVANAVKNGTISCEGAVRHVPTDLDASPTSAWEKAGSPLNTYQNGAYWHTPTGWLIEALIPENSSLAQQIFDEYIAHLRKFDFRLGAKSQAPWECFGRNGQSAQNGVYMTSVALPWPILNHLSKAPKTSGH